MVLLLLAISGGTFLRLYNIGRYGFWTDELFHVFAAKSYMADGSLRIPWEKEEYIRALPVTMLTVQSFKLLGESEAAARLPFALANIAFILIAYGIIRQLFSRHVAVIFAASISLSIFAIQMSQECRMYTLFQLFYFLMSIAFLYGFEPVETASGGTSGAAKRRWSAAWAARSGMSVGFLALAVGFGIVAVSLHDLTYNFLFPVLAYCIVMLLHRGRSAGPWGALRSKYGALLVSVGALGLLFAVVRLPVIAGVIQVAIEAPSWNRTPQSNLSYYHRVLTESHPFMWMIYPLGAFGAVYRYGRRGLFFILSFLVLFLLHCFAFGRVSERYIFHILPFFLVVGAIGVELLFSAAAGVASRSAFRPWQRRLFYAAICGSVLMFLVPRIQRSVLDTSVPKFADWKGLDPAMLEEVTRGTSVTTDRWGFNYYFGGYPDYVIDASHGEHVDGDVVLVTLTELEKVVTEHQDVHLVTYAQHMFHDGFVAPDARAYILREFERVEAGRRDAMIMVFRKR